MAARPLESRVPRTIFNREHTLSKHPRTLSEIPRKMNSAPCYAGAKNQLKSEQPDDLAMLIHIDGLRCRNLGQPGHGHDVPGNRHHKARAIGQPHFADM